MQFSLPLPPPLNDMYRSAVSKYGRPYTYVVGVAKQWKKDACLTIGKNVPHYDVPVLLKLKVYLKRDRDYDSSLKLLSDVLQMSGVVENDRLIYRAEIEKFKPSDNPRVEIEVVPYVGK